MIKPLYSFVLCLGFLMAGAGVCGAEPERVVPPDFRSVGTYELIKRVKLRSAKAVPIAIKSLRYEVFTNGTTVRCYGTKGNAYTEFEIYRRDGISMSRSDGLIERVPGIQAQTLVGQVLRQLSLTEETLTISRFPAHSQVVEITYARRLRDKIHQLSP